MAQEDDTDALQQFEGCDRIGKSCCDGSGNFAYSVTNSCTAEESNEDPVHCRCHPLQGLDDHDIRLKVTAGTDNIFCSSGMQTSPGEICKREAERLETSSRVVAVSSEPANEEEDLDLPLNGQDKSHVYSVKSYKYNRKRSPALYVDTTELKIKCLDETLEKKEQTLPLSKQEKLETTGKKQDGSDNHDSNHVESRLDVTAFLKHRIPVRKQVQQVFMLHRGSSDLHLPTPVSESPKSPEDPNFPSNCNDEMMRLATYGDYPHDCPVFVTKLARDGFIYRPALKTIDCFFCRASIPVADLYRPGFDPLRHHSVLNANCPVKQGIDCGNKPVPLPEEFTRFREQATKWNRGSNEAEVGPSPSLPAFSSDDAQRLTTETQHDTGPRSLPNTLTHTPSPMLATDGGMNPHLTRDGVNVPNSVQGFQNENRNDSAPTRVPLQAALDQQFRVAQSSIETDSVPDITHPQGSVSLPQVRSNEAANVSSRQPQAQPARSTSLPAKSAPSNPNRSNNNTARSSGTSTNTAGAAKNSSNTSTAQNASSQQNTSGSNGGNGGSNGANGDKPAKKKLTYSDLGIFAEKPKRPDMAVLTKRVLSFRGKWNANYTQTPDMLGEAGMYYAGYADCARCFFCGGGLKNWESPDNPWIEHARWFPKCAYIRMCKGAKFVEIVQRKNKNKERITLKAVEDEVAEKGTSNGASNGSSGSAGSSQQNGAVAARTSHSGATADVNLEQLEAENEELKSEVTCKICMDHDSCVVFLPCGHLVACTQCAIALKNCPLCRAEIKGSVKAYMT